MKHSHFLAEVSRIEAELGELIDRAHASTPPTVEWVAMLAWASSARGSLMSLAELGIPDSETPLAPSPPPHPPTWPALIAELRRLNAAYDGPGPVSLNLHGLLVPSDSRTPEEAPLYGREELPGDDRPFDAPAAARRLLAALKAGEAAC